MLRLDRTTNTFRNLGFGFLHKTAALLFPFLIRTVLIYRLGTEYLGLGSLFSSVLQVLNLAELGFGSAVVYCLYRPIAEQDLPLIRSYLHLFRKIYRLIGLAILAAGLLLIPLLPHLIKDPTLPDGLDLRFCYLFFLSDTVISYLLFGYKTAIPQALQRQDLLSRIDFWIVTAKCLCQTASLLLFGSFYLYLLITPLMTVIRNLAVSHLVGNRYPEFLPKRGLPRSPLTDEAKKDLRTRVSGIFIGNLCITSRNGIDSICLTAFVGLSAAAIYNNYYVLMHAVVVVSMVFCQSMIPGLGNSIVTQSREKNLQDMRRLEFAYMLLAGWAAAYLLCLFQPFMFLWMGPKRMLGMREVVLFTVYFYLLKMGDMRWIYSEAAGLWWDCRYVTVFEAFLNITLNLLLGRFFGLVGILLATVLSMLFVNFLMTPRFLFSRYFPRSELKPYFLSHLRYFAASFAVTVTVYLCCHFAAPDQPVLKFLVSGAFCLLIPPALYYLFYRHTENYQFWSDWLKARLLKRKRRSS